MNKKFKLIKPYPGSPKLDTIVINNEKLNSAHTLDKNYYFNGLNIENQPEFWQEIVEKDYEILSFRSNRLDFYQPRIQKDGTYLDNPINSQKGNGATLEWMLNEPEYYIESVKRLSDGEVFTLGDTVDFNKMVVGKLIRIDFERAPIDKGAGKLCFVNDHPVLGYWWEIGQLTKVEDNPLFTTVDGKELKYGDKFYVVDTKFFKIFEAEAGVTFKTDKWIKNSYSDKKLAEEWILMNKPVLSLEDLLSVWSTDNLYNVYKESPMFQNFKKVAESKIKGDE